MALRSPLVFRGAALSTVLFVGVAIASLGLTAKVLLGSPGVDPALSAVRPSPRPAVTQPAARRVLFIGGWITEGAAASPAQQAADALRWQADIASHHGAAFMRGGTDGAAPLARQVVTDAGGRSPAALVVSAGSYDSTRSPADERLAVLHLIDRLRVTVPDTTALVLLGPPPPDVASGADAAVRRAIADAARERQVHYADPVLNSWSADGASLVSGLSGYLERLHIDVG